MVKKNRQLSPWSWIPTLYIAEGLPYFAVNSLTVLIYFNMGVGLAEMAFFTSWLYLPWVIKPFWSPFVDLIRSKRFWIVAMQLAITLTMAGVAFLLPFSFFFQATLVCFWLMAFFSATHDIAADGFYMLALSSHEQAAYVGLRSTFYRIASVLGQGGLVILAGWLEKTTGNIPLAWTIVFGALSVLFLVLTIYHAGILPRPASDHPVKDMPFSQFVKEFGLTFATFFRKPHILSALAFMLLYRLPEALCLKLTGPFMLAPRNDGGLALSTAQVGIANGTVGVIALLAGGIIGGLAIAHGGLRRWLWPMALSLTLPCLFYCFLAMFQPDNFAWICVAVAVEQFGYGFGFTAFMLYLIYFSRGESATSHYAFCTAFMALGMMLPGMVAGKIHDSLQNISIFASGNPQGYVNFFWVVVLCSLVTFLVTSLIHVDPDFGKKSKAS